MPWCEESGTSIFYDVGGNGPTPIVLLHELGGSIQSWDAVVPLLATEFRILRYDHRGAGLSEKVRLPYTMADHLADLDAVITASGVTSPFFIAGAAMGAAIAVMRSARVPSSVLGMILCPPALGVDAARRDYLVERTRRSAIDGIRATVDETLGRSYPPSIRSDGVAYAAYRARFLANDPVAYGLANMAFAESTAEADIPAVGCPCLLVAGTSDNLRPVDQVRALAPRFRNATVDVIESGHLMAVQAPTELAVHIRRFCTHYHTR